MCGKWPRRLCTHGHRLRTLDETHHAPLSPLAHCRHPLVVLRQSLHPTSVYLDSQQITHSYPTGPGAEYSSPQNTPTGDPMETEFIRTLLSLSKPPPEFYSPMCYGMQPFPGLP